MSTVSELADWWFRDRTDDSGRWVIAQFPNVSIAVFGAATGARLLLDTQGAAGTALSTVAGVALAWWAVDEVVRGVNPWRRALGAGVLAAELAVLAASVW